MYSGEKNGMLYIYVFISKKHNLYSYDTDGDGTKYVEASVS